jgi:hypothetical protein
MRGRLKLYVGYDSREDIAWQVCRHSIHRHARAEVELHPLVQNSLRELGLYTRPPDQGATTEFSLTRFLTPYVAAHDGWTIFMDCDFLWTVDVHAILGQLDDTKAVYVVKHDYVPASATKMDGQVQTTYPRKNWSSLMVFNGAHPSVKTLTPEVVNSESPGFLHRFNWVDDADIGELPLTWNFLVGEYEPPAVVPNVIHYTNGGPWFPNCQDVDYADLWCAERDLYERSVGRLKATV